MIVGACQVVERFLTSFRHVQWYLVPVLPFVSRALLCLRFRRLMNEVPPEAAQERDLHRTTVLALAGFSFTVVVGLSVLDIDKRPGLQLSIWFVLVSCVSYLAAFNLQSYKVTRFQDQFATALIEAGSLSLVLTLLSLLFNANFDRGFQWAAAALAIGFWLADHVTRLRLDYKFLFAKQDEKLKKGTPNGDSKESSGEAASGKESGGQAASGKESGGQAASGKEGDSEAAGSKEGSR